MKLSAEDVTKLYGADGDGEALQSAFESGNINVAVYGLGKMGLPVAVVFANITSRVLGVDVDDGVVERINDGECPVVGEPRLPGLVRAAVDAGSMRATTEGVKAASWADFHLVLVPTTIEESGRTDLSNLAGAVRSIGAGLEAGDMVAIESTVPPGTCEEVVRPRLAEESGLDTDAFGVAFCPERTQSGRALRDIRAAYDRIVGGIDDESTEIARLVYDLVTTKEVITVEDTTTAECVKVFEGVYRDVNIALANELAKFADELDVDVNAAIEAANTQPFCDIHQPGIGVGGHCIPYYPYFLINGHETEVPLVRTARRINDGMPLFALTKLTELLEERDVDVADARVLVLGLAYRPGVDETRESPARPIIDHLNTRGATVIAVDPVVESTAAFDTIDVTVDDVEALDLDAAVLVTAHEAFEGIDWSRLDPMVVIDGRQALDLDDSHHSVYTIGSGLHVPG
jgi:UDP-N-acetyl-D-mannosaminuronic acid dehydrogenase